MENQFPYFHILFFVGFLPTDFGLCFALCILSNVCNQLVVIITYPDVDCSIELAQKLDDLMSPSWENRDIFVDQEDMTADMTTLT